MIKQLTVSNHEQLMAYLQPEAAFNLFIIGDIEQFGYDKDYQKLHGEFDGDKLHAVLLQYRENLVFYRQSTSLILLN